jgi:GH24 family phage-related lysozyme (muramidase)
MSNTAPITLEQLFRFWRALPHQQAAIAELEADLRENGYAVAMKRDRPWFSTWSQAGKQADDAWLAPALEIIKRWEGCRLEAYPDPGTGGEPWTIGYGITRIAGQPVRPGQKITQAEADALLEAEVRTKGQQVLGLLPMAAQWRPNQVAAIVSLAFNIGAGALERSTLRKRLLAGEDPAVVVGQELPRWNRAGDKVMEGLVRRRADEVRLFGVPKLDLPAQQPSGSVLLKVPYFSQRDNISGQGERECASSSAAMVAAFYGKVAGDDAYNVIRAKFGDTTDVNAHVQALRSLGLDARFRTDGTPATLKAELRAGRPVMVGWLHHGPVSKPTGGGHYSVVIGFDATHWIQNDPYGQADMVNGGYVSAKGGAGIRYTRRNWDRRWLPDGKGWCLMVRPM